MMGKPIVKIEVRQCQHLLKRVYKQEGKPCPQCGTSVEVVDYQNRKVYYCPTCQKEG